MVCEVTRKERGLFAVGFVSELPSAVYPKFPEIKKIKELKVI